MEVGGVGGRRLRDGGGIRGSEWIINTDEIV